MSNERSSIRISDTATHPSIRLNLFVSIRYKSRNRLPWFPPSSFLFLFFPSQKPRRDTDKSVDVSQDGTRCRQEREQGERWSFIVSRRARKRERERSSLACLVLNYSPSLYSLPFLRPFYTAEDCINRQRGESPIPRRFLESNTLLLAPCREQLAKTSQNEISLWTVTGDGEQRRRGREREREEGVSKVRRGTFYYQPTDM